MPDPVRPSAERAIALFRQRFLNRTDKVAILADWGSPCPIDAGDSLDALLATHLLGTDAPAATARWKTRQGTGAAKGHFRIGSYCPGPENLTRWLCLDFDGAGHADALADPAAAARSAHDAFVAAGLQPYVERSGGGKGWHLWSFFDPPIAAAKAQALGRALAPKEAPLTDGRFADPSSAKGIEVFPKQARIKRDGYGNLVWLPWWKGAPEGANLFHRVGAAGALEPYLPGEFQTAAADLVERLLAAHAPAAPIAKTATRTAPTAATDATAAVWREWRTKALAALPIESVYGTWLTGEAVESGWLQCRDPDSPSGDENPSAGVADGTGDAERGAFHSFRREETVSVFDFLVARGEAADFRAAEALVAERAGVPLPPRPTRRAFRPRFRVNGRQLRDLVADAWRAVHAANRSPHPLLFVRSGALVRLSENGARIEAVEEDAFHGHLAEIADWVKETEQMTIDTSPSREATRVMRVRPDAALPVLDAVVTTPVFDEEGRLVAVPGYHQGARLWLQRPEGFDLASVPETPTADDVRAARELLLEELLVDFPFVVDSDRAHALAALLLPLVRRMVSGCTPIHLLEAPTPGSGKGLLADVLAIVALGHPCEPTTITADEDEARKKITSILARAQPMILIDNVRHGLDSAQLAAALTAETWSDRLLGQTKMLDLPNRATWLVTANNPRLSLEIARRCVRVRLDAKTDRPWQRTGFKYPRLRDWARANRARLVHAALVLVRAWIAAGRPAGARTLGSFESWASVLGGILDCAGIPGFLQDTEKLYEDADAEGQDWRAFVAAWWEKHGGSWVAAGDLLALVRERDLLGQVVGEKSERSQLIRLGRALSAARDRHFGDFSVAAGRNSNSKAAQYRLLATADSAAAAASAPVPAARAAPATALDLADFDSLAL